ncbi:NADPH-dependent F420 reductase [Flavisolibacter nicotianae]|uniref:NADPH-dependent F420 reductase n=1 Tax=Flavisolibacter nicotianae TaxID=2364882 RepID=UPI000EB21396|nr:NAD(P)-binding domain-containing protein [Flavisolibacter nicotianae]
MKIGIIGSGIVGRVLATAFLTEGHQVMIGTRDPQKEDVVKWAKKNPSGKAGLFAEAAAFGDLLVLAVAGIAAEQAVQESGLENFRGKTVIDVTNPIAKEPPVNGVLSFFTDGHTSLMEKLQALLPDAHLVKAFNSVGNAQMYKPQYTEGRPTMFICGNDDGARKTVTEILTAFGWDTEDMGKAEAARAIEPLCILWCIPGFLYNRWTHAFKLLKS